MNGDIVETTPASDLFLSNLQQQKKLLMILFPKCNCIKGFYMFFAKKHFSKVLFEKFLCLEKSKI